MNATVIELLKKNFIKFSTNPDPTPAYSEIDPETQELRFKIRYAAPATPAAPSLPTLDDILTIIPSGSVTSILVTSSLPGNGFWPILVQENDRHDDPAHLPHQATQPQTHRRRCRRRSLAFTVEGGTRKRIFEPIMLPKDAPGADFAMQAYMESVFKPVIRTARAGRRRSEPRPRSETASPIQTNRLRAATPLMTAVIVASSRPWARSAEFGPSRAGTRRPPSPNAAAAAAAAGSPRHRTGRRTGMPATDVRPSPRRRRAASLRPLDTAPSACYTGRRTAAPGGGQVLGACCLVRAGLLVVFSPDAEAHARDLAAVTEISAKNQARRSLSRPLSFSLSPSLSLGTRTPAITPTPTKTHTTIPTRTRHCQTVSRSAWFGSCCHCHTHTQGHAHTHTSLRYCFHRRGAMHVRIARARGAVRGRERGREGGRER